MADKFDYIKEKICMAKYIKDKGQIRKIKYISKVNR